VSLFWCYKSLRPPVKFLVSSCYINSVPPPPLFFTLHRVVPLLTSVLQSVLFSCFGDVLFSFWHVSCCTLWLCYMTSFGQYFFVNDLVLKFIIPTSVLFAYDRKIWLDVKSAED
jgi:hypothetical protein